MKSETIQQVRIMTDLMMSKSRAIVTRTENYIDDLEKLPGFPPGAATNELLLGMARESRVAGVARSIAVLLRAQGKRLSNMADEFDIFGAQ